MFEGVGFEWDPEKERSNRRKHGSSFATVLPVFTDPLALTIRDGDEHGEERWRIIGSVGRHDLLFVSFSVREERDGSETVRVISALRATRLERGHYENERHRQD